MTHKDIVQKLVGSINPVGDSSRDTERFENLKIMCDLVEDLLEEIKWVTRSAESYESSVKRSGEYAQKFINNLKEEL